MVLLSLLLLSVCQVLQWCTSTPEVVHRQVDEVRGKSVSIYKNGHECSTGLIGQAGVSDGLRVKNGVVVMGCWLSVCKDAPMVYLLPQKWFTAKVKSVGKSVSIYKNGQNEWQHRLAAILQTTGKVRVVVPPNGYKNTIRYKDYKLRELH
ncbi:hypothetical protein QZH41_016324, partial [Actinostola sp. cb2023]